MPKKWKWGGRYKVRLTRDYEDITYKQGDIIEHHSAYDNYCYKVLIPFKLSDLISNYSYHTDDACLYVMKYLCDLGYVESYKSNYIYIDAHTDFEDVDVDDE